jgi:hypothetical protein
VLESRSLGPALPSRRLAGDRVLSGGLGLLGASLSKVM